MEQTERFNREVIGLPIPERPTRLDPERKAWALGALREELDELASSEVLEEEVDALLDLVYFALGRVVEMGVAVRPAFETIHAANMAKQRGALSKRPYSRGYDAVKPEGWKAPDLRPLLEVTLADLQSLHFLARLIEDNPSGTDALMTQQLLPHGDDVFQPNLCCELAELPLPRPRVLVLGYARHGKDTVAEMLGRLYGMRFTSSSEFCAAQVVMPAIDAAWAAYEDEQRGRNRQPPTVPRYASVAECFADRVNHRAFWYDTIRAFNQDDPTSLARAIFEENDVYCGLRHRAEFHAVVNAGIPDMVVWVDRSDHLPPEDRSSCSVEPWMADFVVDNNGSLEDLERNVRSLFDRFLGEPA
jgi:hypothetical protein